MRRIVAVSLAVTFLQACAAHQAAKAGSPAGPGRDAAAPPPAGSETPYGPAVVLRSPAPVEGFGAVHFPVSCTPEAQVTFDVGVAQLHSFYYPETMKTFARVIELDPGCAMARWGLAFAQMPNPLVPPFAPAAMERAAQSVREGRALARTDRERAWLEALEPLFLDAATLDQPERQRRYLAGMESLAARYPDDDEAQVFLALALLQAADPHDRTFASQFHAARILKKLEPTHPGHPGIAHYEIHAFDYSPIAEQGLAAADAYAAIAPAAPHAVHMPSHVYSMLGLWDRSIASNLATLDVAQAYADRNFAPGVTHSSVPHSLDFLAYAYLQQGREREARDVVVRMAAIEKLNVVTLAQATPMNAIPARYALERGAWEEAAALPVRHTPFPYADALGHFARAVGAARTGTMAGQLEAREEVAALDAAWSAYRQDRGQEYWAQQTEVLLDAASAWLARAEGDDAAAARLLRSAADLEDSGEKHVALENRLYPAREQLAELLLEAGQAEAALREYQASMRTAPNRLRGLRGAARAAELAGHPGVAREYQDRIDDLTAGHAAPPAARAGIPGGVAALPAPPAP